MNQTIVFAALAIIAFLLIRSGAKFVAKAIGVLVLIAAGAYFLYFGKSSLIKDNVATIDYLKEKYCEDPSSTKCACIVMKLESDIKNRFNEEEIASMKEDRFYSALVLKKTIKAQSNNIQSCVDDKGEPKAFQDFKNDFIPIQNKYLEEAGEMGRNAKEKVKGKIQDFIQKNKDVDSRY